jgi:uncharacterized membrane protein YhaH (DUF805 family)
MAGALKYLSFRGRANRQRYWLTVLALFGLLLAIGLSGLVLRVAPLLSVIVIPVWLAVIVAVFANSARRLHDRGKSAWWLVVFVVLPGLLLGFGEAMSPGGAGDADGPAALMALLSLPFSIWGLVEMGFLKGTTGPNKFGEDPLGPPAEEAFA